MFVLPLLPEHRAVWLVSMISHFAIISTGLCTVAPLPPPPPLPLPEVQTLIKKTAVVRVVVVGGSYAGVELSCNLATELVKGRKGNGASGKVEVTLAAGSEVTMFVLFLFHL